jgi:lysophospholipase L1-like esterase
VGTPHYLSPRQGPASGGAAPCTPAMWEKNKNSGDTPAPPPGGSAPCTPVGRVGTIILLCLLLLLSDCAGLPGQSAAGQSAVQQAPKARLVYVAIGASDTFGIGSDDPQTQNWPADLAARFGAGVHLVNLGIPSITTEQALHIELPVALDAHPQLVTIWLAVNDLVDNIPASSYEHSLDLLLTRLQAGAPHAVIIMANVPDLTLLPRFQSAAPGPLLAEVQAYNNAIASVVARHHVLFVNLFKMYRLLAQNPDYISDDGFHPSTEGYIQLANLFYQVLQQNGKSRL